MSNNTNTRTSKLTLTDGSRVDLMELIDRLRIATNLVVGCNIILSLATEEGEWPAPPITIPCDAAIYVWRKMRTRKTQCSRQVAIITTTQSEIKYFEDGTISVRDRQIGSVPVAQRRVVAVMSNLRDRDEWE